MSKHSFFLLAPQGAGKSRNAEKIATLLGCTGIVENWQPGDTVPPGALVLGHALHIVPAEAASSAAIGARTEMRPDLQSLEAECLRLQARVLMLKAEQLESSLIAGQQGRRVRPPYSREFVTCRCNAVVKDDCPCIQAALDAQQPAASGS